MDVGAKFLEDEVNTHWKHQQTVEVLSLRERAALPRNFKPPRKESCKGKQGKQEKTEEIINSTMEEKLQVTVENWILTAAHQMKSNTKLS